MTTIAAIPRTALWLGLAGTLPFIAATLAIVLPSHVSAITGAPLFVTAVAGKTALLLYGNTIMAFMSGVLWGFAAQAQGPRAVVAYCASVIPALYVFFASFATVGNPTAKPLIFGFVWLLLFDYGFRRNQLAPIWWMPLRAMITAIVLVCLLAAEYFG